MMTSGQPQHAKTFLDRFITIPLVYYITEQVRSYYNFVGAASTSGVNIITKKNIGSNDFRF